MREGEALPDASWIALDVCSFARLGSTLPCERSDLPLLPLSLISQMLRWVSSRGANAERHASEHRQRHPWLLEPGEPVPETNALPVLQAEVDVGRFAKHRADAVTASPYNKADDREDLEPWQQSILEEYDL
jgi:hypothetical protein